MQNVLENPVWNALVSNNSNLANGTGEVKYFDSDVSPFVGVENYSPEVFKQMLEVLPDDRTSLLFSTHTINFSDDWNVLFTVPGYQLVHTGVNLPEDGADKIVKLNTGHITQMLELTKLTKPGPFEQRTIEFGTYHGIFSGDQLVAMAGDRMNPYNYMEISAVCTHPDHLGRGYARQLLARQANHIMASGNIPFLHVRNDNDRAIKVYQSLGFSISRDVFFYVIRKAEV